MFCPILHPWLFVLIKASFSADIRLGNRTVWWCC